MKTKEKKKAPRRPSPSELPPCCDVLLSRVQICAALGISLRTFQGMISARDFPPFDTRLGAFPRWHVKTLNEWIAGRCRKD